MNKEENIKKKNNNNIYILKTYKATVMNKDNHKIKYLTNSNNSNRDNNTNKDNDD